LFKPEDSPGPDKLSSQFTNLRPVVVRKKEEEGQEGTTLIKTASYSRP
jgi:hypothetical protein